MTTFIDADVITEDDIYDPTTVWVRCEDCDDADHADEMIWQSDGAWLCVPCDNDMQREYDEQRRYLDRIRYL